MHSKLPMMALAVAGWAVGLRAEMDRAEIARTAAPLTSVAQVLNLSEADAARALPVRLQGVVIGEAPPVGKAFVLWDGSESIYVRDENARDAGTFQRGDRVELEATSDVGGFTPSLQMRAGRKLGEGTIPTPQTVTADQLLSGRCDAQWVRVRGIVRHCEPTTVWAGRWRLMLAMGGQLLTVHVNADLSPERLVDAEVTVDGLVFNQHNMNRQAVSALLFVPAEVPIVVDVAAPADPFAAPVRAVGRLLQFDRGGRGGHRVHVRGHVIHHQPGVAFWIRDGDRGLYVRSSQVDELQPGDLVDVVGFPVQGGYTPRLEDATFRKTEGGAAPPAVVPANAREAIAHDCDLIALEARLVERRRVPEGVALVFEWQGGLVAAALPLDDGQPVPSDWTPGALVRATGVCAVPNDEPGRASGTWEPRTFELKVRNSADLAVLHSSPWWTRQRLFWGLGIVTGALLLALAVVLLVARRRLQQQALRRAKSEGEFSAILSERNRMAREIHDTLAQGLAAISMRLELARNATEGDRVGIARHLEAAHQLTRGTLAEARASIWNMRSQVLENNDLAGALEGLLRQLADGTPVEASFRVAGDRIRLPPVVESELLRIGQEAIANALRHAAPRHLEVALTFAERRCELVINDDGIGFDPKGAAPRAGSFGLVGMRERASQIGASFALTSAPGRGTHIAVTVQAPD